MASQSQNPLIPIGHHPALRMSVCLFIALVALSSTSSRANDVVNPPTSTGPASELHIGRLVFDVHPGSSWGPGRPWWRIDWPEAEFHFTNGVKRYTSVDVESDSVHLSLTDDAIFDYPFVFAQQVGRWQMSDAEAATLGEYLLRGGFLIVDDFHGPYQWDVFNHVVARALPGHTVESIDFEDAALAIQYSMDQQTQIPGHRHIMGFKNNGDAVVRMPHSPPQWRGIHDDKGRLMVVINFNMDMGDAWEHADDPSYPNNMTSFSYRLGINYLIHAMTH